MNYNPYEKPAFAPNTKGGVVSETGRNQHTLITVAYCPFCDGETPQVVYYSYNTAILHECGTCSHQIWNQTRYSHTTTRHTTALAVRRTLDQQGNPREWKKLFIDLVPQGEQCLLCRSYSPDDHPSRRCDRPSRPEGIAC